LTVTRFRTTVVLQPLRHVRPTRTATHAESNHLAFEPVELAEIDRLAV
jgi:hypothetical protein